MNKLSEEQINELLNEYDIDVDTIELLENLFSDYRFNEFEYFNIIAEIVSEYQTLKINKELQSSLAEPYENLKDIIIKVLKYKLRNVTHNNSKYEIEIKKLILELNEN